MDWKPKFETVLQVSARERDLLVGGSLESVFSKYQLPERKGLNRLGEFPVAVARCIYEALGYTAWFSGQAKLGESTYLLARMPGRRR
jgi:hypothetical protein